VLKDCKTVGCSQEAIRANSTFQLPVVPSKKSKSSVWMPCTQLIVHLIELSQQTIDAELVLVLNFYILEKKLSMFLFFMSSSVIPPLFRYGLILKIAKGCKLFALSRVLSFLFMNLIINKEARMPFKPKKKIHPVSLRKWREFPE
jgi:hypothetical protein